MSSALTHPARDADNAARLRVIVVTNQWPRPDLPYCGIMVVRQVEALRRTGVEIELITITGGLRSYLAAARAVIALNRGPRRADVLHAHTGHCGVLACLQLRYPVILTYVGYDIDTPAEDKEGPRTQLERVIFRSLSVLFAATIAKSARGAAKLPRLGRLRNRVIPNGVDRNLFAPVDRAAARSSLDWGEELTVLFAADPTRFTKRFELAEEVVGRVRDTFPDVRIAIAAGVDPVDMPVWMSAADVLLLTSRGEGSPNVVKEAMACDLPIVAVDVGDVRDVVMGTRGCYVCSDDPEELAGALVEALSTCPKRSDGRSRSEWLDDAAIASSIAGVYRVAQTRGPGALGFLSRRSRTLSGQELT